MLIIVFIVSVTIVSNLTLVLAGQAGFAHLHCNQSFALPSWFALSVYCTFLRLRPNTGPEATEGKIYLGLQFQEDIVHHGGRRMRQGE